MTSNDTAIHEDINRLVAREHELRSKLAAGQITAPAEHEELGAIEVQLDRCWDLLRQRQALRDAGADPSSASERSAAEAEGYRN